MDGSNIKRLFKGTKVVWPNGVTIDYIAERVYWVDAREDYIASCNLDGDNVVKVITDNVRQSSIKFLDYKVCISKYRYLKMYVLLGSSVSSILSRSVQR